MVPPLGTIVFEAFFVIRFFQSLTVCSVSQLERRMRGRGSVLRGVRQGQALRERQVREVHDSAVWQVVRQVRRREEQQAGLRRRRGARSSGRRRCKIKQLRQRHPQAQQKLDDRFDTILVVNSFYIYIISSYILQLYIPSW